MISLLDPGTDYLESIVEHEFSDSSGGDTGGVGGELGGSADAYFCAEDRDCSGERSLSHFREARWDSSGSRFALTGVDQALYIHNRDGEQLERYGLPHIVPGVRQLLTGLVWSPEGTGLVFHYGGHQVTGCCGAFDAAGYLFELDLESGELKRRLTYSDHYVPVSFHVSVHDGSRWTEQAQTHHPRGLDERIAELGPNPAGSDSAYRVRVTQKGLEEGFVDQLAMKGPAGRYIPPDRARIIGEDRDVADALARRDRAFVDFHEKTVELTWDAEREVSGRLALYAQEAAPRRSGLQPFDYPDQDSGSYTIPLNPDGSWSIDGQPDSERPEPLFATRSVPDTAHKPATVRGYGGTDGEYLYAALDFTVDHTSEDRGDWAALEVKTDEGWQRFRVDARNRQWGEVAFTQSPEADWGHRYYEFKVPLAELGLKAGSIANIRFRAYGSAGEFEEGPGGEEEDPEPIQLRELGYPAWLPSDDALLYQMGYGNDPGHIIRLNDNAKLEPVKAPIGEASRFSPRGRRLIYEADPPEGSCNLSSSGDEVEQLRAFDTLDNLTVDLRVLRSSKEGAFKIQGTIADRHLDRYTLSYSENGKDNWRPIKPAGRQQHVDEQIASWVPPEPGRYFVRMTGYDKAGNSRSAVRQVVWSQQAPLSDIYLDQDLFSPNADGVRDELGIHFRVREPINLSVKIVRDGELVRRFDRSYDTVGEDVWLRWDGRDQDGRVVPDGQYQVVVNGVEYTVTVDNTYPRLSLGMSESPYALECLDTIDNSGEIPQYSAQDIASDPLPSFCNNLYKGALEFLAMDYRLFATSEDSELPLVLETARAGTSDWQSISESAGEIRISLDESRVTDQKFRVRATDQAGNQSTVEYRPVHRGLATVLRAGVYQPSGHNADVMGEEFSHLGAPIPYPDEDSASRSSTFGPIENTAADTHFTISETLTESVVGVYAEYKPIDGDNWTRKSVTRFLDADWQRCKQAAFANSSVCEDKSVTSEISDDRVHLLWDMAQLEPATEENHLRFVLVTADSREVTTPKVRVQPLSFAIADFGYSSLLSPTGIAVPGIIYAVENFTDVAIHVQSDEDPRFEQEQLLGRVPPGPTEPRDGYLDFAVDASSLQQCTQYNVRAVLTLSTGATARVETTYETPCLRLLHRVDYPDVPHEQPEGDTTELVVWPVSESGKALKSIEVYAPLSNGERDVIATETNPANGEPVRFKLDTDTWPVGDTRLAVRLLDVDDNAITEGVTVYKDTAAPELEVPYPLSGNRVCGDQPFQIHYRDRAGSPSSGTPSEGWDQTYALHGLIENRDLAESLLRNAQSAPRTGGSELSATNIDQAKLAGIRQLLSTDEESLSDFSRHPELLVEALAADGSVLQRFPLWDSDPESGTPMMDVPGPKAVDGALVFHSLVDLPWDIAADDGGAREVTLRVRGTDAYGNVSRLERAIRIDAQARSPDYQLRTDGASGSEVYISPDGDGYKDSVEVPTRNHESGTLEWRLYSDEKGSEPLGVLKRVDSAAAGDYSYSWDGTLNGSRVQDGEYSIVPVLVDGCGNTSAVEGQGKRIVVDTRDPRIGKVEPAANGTLGLVAQLKAQITEENLNPDKAASMGLSYREEGDSSEVAIDYQGNEVDEDIYELDTEWNTYGLTGDHELIWRAQDRAGNQTEHIIPVELINKADLLASFQVDTPFISPNGDGNLDLLRYRVGVRKNVNLTVTLLDPDNTELAEIHAGELAPGEHALTWNGNLENDQVVDDGRYRIRARATSVATPSLQQDADQHFRVDTQKPQAKLPELINGFLAEPFALKVGVFDDTLKEYRVALDNGDQEQVLREGDTNLAETTLKTLNKEEQEGSYILHVTASDRAGNQLKQRLPFDLDVSAPELTWERPSASLFGGSESESIPWRLALDEAHPQRLDVTLNTGDTEVATLHDDSVATDAVDGEAAIDGLNGEYQLVANLTDKAANATEVRKTVDIDHQAPEISLDEPADGSFITGEFNAQVSISEANLERWTLSLRKPDGTLVRGLENRNEEADTTLGGYRPPADGAYQLVLSAEDAVGYTNEVSHSVEVDTHPPEAPSGLSIEALDGGNHRLSWQPSRSDDTSHYRVYDKTNEVAGPVEQTHYEFDAAENREYRFTVVAVDQAGLNSEASAPLDWVLDTVGPEVRFASPSAGELVSGLVDVVGSVYAEDLAEYTLAVASAQAPDQWRTLATSSLTRRGERMTQWSTLDESGDGDYTLRLQAQDHSDNTSETTVPVTVDNTAPDAPANLSASASEDDISLNWDTSPSDDVEGYLLLRNDSIVNADGPVVGEVTPYLIDGESHLDEAVVDGTHSYSVHAVDEAGNVSGPATTEIELDLKAPAPSWSRPDAGTEFENNLALRVRAEARDISVVTFRYRAAGETQWTELSQSSNQRPFVYTWATENLALGDYEIQAVARDEGGRSGSTTVRVVTRADLTAPAAPSKPAASVDEDTVTLTWEASSSDDVAEYVIRMADSASEVARVPESSTTLEVPELTDGTYSFVINAVDNAGNTSTKTSPVEVLIFTPSLEYSDGITVDPTMDFAGNVSAGRTVEVFRVENGKRSRIQQVSVGSEGYFETAAVELISGINQFSFQAITEDGDRSKFAADKIVHASTPGAVRNLTHSFEDPDERRNVTLEWEEPSNASDAYFLIRDDQNELLLDASSPVIQSYSSSSSDSSWNSVAYAFDDDEGTDYEFYEDRWSLTIKLDDLAWLTSLRTLWDDQPKSVTAFGKVADVWHPLGQLKQVGDEQGWKRKLATPIPVTEVRLEGRNSEAGDAELVEFSARRVQPDTATSFSYQGDLREDRLFKVSAINTFGIEGASKEEAVEVGDWQPPDAVTLSANVAGKDVQLDWTASSADTAKFLIYRGDEPVARVDSSDSAITTYIDKNVANGTYGYRVRAEDRAGNLGEFSNRVTVTVSAEPPDAPTSVSASPDSLTGCMDLSWPASENAVEYIVLRSDDGAAVQEVARVETAEYRDCGLDPDVDYRYEVVAVDAAGNGSDPVGSDTEQAVDEQPPPTPTIRLPVWNGEVHESSASGVEVAGGANAGNKVVLLRDGYRVADTTARNDAGDGMAERYKNSEADSIAMGPNGERLALVVDNAVEIRRWPSGELLQRVDGAFAPSKPVIWIDEQRLAVFSQTSNNIDVHRINLENTHVELIVEWEIDWSQEVRQWYYDYTRKGLVVVSDNSSPDAFHVDLIDPVSGDKSQLMKLDRDDVSAFKLDPDHQRVLWSSSGTSRIYDMASGTNTTIACSGQARGWKRSTGQPVLADDTSLFVCRSDGSRTVLDDDLGTLINRMQHPVSPKDAQFVLLKEESANTASVEAFDGQKLRSIGTINYQDGDTPFVPGYLPQGRIWYHFVDPDTSAPGLQFGPPVIDYRFPSVNPGTGTHDFSVYAEDRFGNRSDVSEAIEIRAPATPVTNLNVSLQLTAAVGAGDPVPVDVEVNNTGNQPTQATDLKVTVFTPGGQRMTLLQDRVPALEAGAKHTHEASWSATGDGVAVFEAKVDEQGSLDEDNRDDNHAIADLRVSPNREIALALGDKTLQGEPGEQRYVHWSLSNPRQSDYQGSLELLVTDDSGQALEELGSVDIASLPAGESLSGRQAFRLPAFQPGEYELRMRFGSDALVRTATDTTTLTVESDLRLGASLSSGARQYSAHDPVSLSAELEHSGVSGTLPSATLTVVALDPDGGELQRWQKDLPTLLPGDVQRHAFDWNTGTRPPGNYRFRMQVHDGDGARVLERTHDVVIDSAGAAMTGILEPESNVVGLDRPLTVEWGAINDSNVALGDLTLVVEARRADASAVNLASRTLDLTVDSRTRKVTSLDTSGLSRGTWDLALVGEVTLGGTPYRQQLASMELEVRDIEPPVVRMSAPQMEATVNGTSTLLAATAQDPISGVDRVQWRPAGGTWRPMNLTGERFTASLVPLAEGDAVVEVRAVDGVGNTSSPRARALRVDNTNPSVTIAGVESGRFYADSVQPEVTVTDASELSIEQSLNDAGWTGEPILGEGTHELVVEAVDAAGNRTRQSVLFTIDTTAPDIVVDGVSDGGLYNQAVTPVVSVNDAHPDELRLTLNGAAYTAGTPVEAESTHQLAIEAEDKAGNQSMRTLSFRIDTTPPPAPTVTSIDPGNVVNELEQDIAGATEAGSTVTLTHGGAPRTTTADSAGQFRFDSITFPEGEQTLSLVAEDAAGNISDATTFNFIVQPDIEPPEIAINGVQDEGYYGEGVSAGVDITDKSAITSSQIRLNGADYTPGTTIEGDGDYTLVVSAEDEYGNQASRSLSFHIDTKPPELAVNGIRDGGEYNEGITPTFTIEDASPVELTLTLDGQAFDRGDEVRSEGEHRLLIKAVDAAGNETTRELRFVQDFTPPPQPVITEPDAGETVLGPDVDVEGTTEADAKVELTLNGRVYGTRADAAGAFQWNGALDEGSYSLKAVAVDSAGNRSSMAQLQFTVRTMNLVVEPIDANSTPRVLLWHGRHPGRGHRRGESRSWYEKALKRRDIAVTAVDNETRFREELASGAHNLILLVSPIGDFGPPLDMHADTRMRIRGSVARGYGLVWINTMPNLKEAWQDLIGARTVSVLKLAESVRYRIDEDEIRTGGYPGTASGVHLNGGKGEGKVEPDCDAGFGMWLKCRFGDDKYPAAVINDYGRGDVKMLTFAPSKLADTPMADAVLEDVVTDVSPSELEPVQDVAALAGLRVSRDFADRPLSVRVQVPEGVRLQPDSATEVVDERHARWRMKAGVDHARINYRLKAVDPGEHSVRIKVVDLYDGAVVKDKQYPFVLERSASELIEAMENKLDEEMQKGGWRPGLHAAQRLLDWSVAAYEQEHYRRAYHKLYMAMLKVRLTPDYNRELMTLMGEYQRLLVVKKQESGQGFDGFHSLPGSPAGPGRGPPGHVSPGQRY